MLAAGRLRALIVGGFAILLIERLAPSPRVHTVDTVTPGLARTLAPISGGSIACATLMRRMAFGLSRQSSTEFSFCLALPMMCAATAYDLLKSRESLSAEAVGIFAVGVVAALLSALAAMRLPLRVVSTPYFHACADHRIGCGLLVLIDLLS